MTFTEPHINIFKKSLKYQKPWKGINAKGWGSYFQSDVSTELDKKFVRADFLSDAIQELDNIELCMAILSWGGMNREHGRSLFANWEWLTVVEKLRKGEISRSEGYRQFADLRKQGLLKGMGPAYFTKLICFLNRDLNGYIMDQWTGKSINTLLGEKRVKLNKNGLVNDRNTPEIYEQFCILIETLAGEINQDPLNTEEYLFSYGGRKKGPWRQHVIKHWEIAQYGERKTAQTEIDLKDVPSHNINKVDNTDMEPIAFKEALKYYTDQWTELPTLGRRSKFLVRTVQRRDSNVFQFQNSKGRQSFVDESHWKAVMGRMEELPADERMKTSRYGMGEFDFNWNECPNRVFSLYVPAVVRHILEREELLERE